MKSQLFVFIILFISYSLNGQVQVGKSILGEYEEDRSGWSVSLSSFGEVVAISAPFNKGYGNDAGHVRIYEWDGTSWVQRGRDIEGEFAGDQAGYSISLSSTGDIVAIGSPFSADNGKDAGHVRVYEWDGTSWVQRGRDIEGENEGDVSGFSVSLSMNGDIIAIGSPFSADGKDIGYVRIFDWDGISWVQRGRDIEGENEGDVSGWSVSLSMNGDFVAIGAPYYEYALGNARVFNLNGINSTYDWDDTLIINVYPNPGSKHVCVSANQDIEGIEIYDIQGKSKIESIYNNERDKKVLLDISELNPGIYYLNLKTRSSWKQVTFIRIND